MLILLLNLIVRQEFPDLYRWWDELLHSLKMLDKLVIFYAFHQYNKVDNNVLAILKTKKGRWQNGN